MIDIKAIEKEARAEVANEKATAAKALIKQSLRRIADAEKVLANLRAEHNELMKDIGTA